MSFVLSLTFSYARSLFALGLACCVRDRRHQQYAVRRDGSAATFVIPASQSRKPTEGRSILASGRYSLSWRVVGIVVGVRKVAAYSRCRAYAGKGKASHPKGVQSSWRSPVSGSRWQAIGQSSNEKERGEPYMMPSEQATHDLKHGVQCEECGTPLYQAGERVPAGTYLRIDDDSFHRVSLLTAGPLPASFDGHVALYRAAAAPCVCERLA